VTPLLSALVEKSLVVFEAQDGVERYRFLEPVRQYALDRLAGSGEAASVQERLREWCLALAEQADRERHGPRQSEWLRRLEAEHDNLRASLDGAHAVPEEAEAELRLATALAWFWHVHNHWQEGRQRLEGALARGETAAPTVRAWALVAAGYLAWGDRDHQRAKLLCEEGRACFQELGDQRGLGWALYALGLATRRQDAARAAEYHCQAEALFRAVGDEAGLALSVYEQGVTAYSQQDYARAAALEEAGLALLRAQGNRRFVADALGALGYCYRQQGNLVRARSLTAESLATFRELGDRWGEAWTARSLAHIVRCLGDPEQAAPLYQSSILLFQEMARPREVGFALVGLGDVALALGDLDMAVRRYVDALSTLQQQHGMGEGTGWLLEKFAGVAAMRGHGRRAARLLGASEALRERINRPVPPADRLDYYERLLLTVRSLLGEPALALAWAEGRALTPEQAVAEGLAEAETPPDALFHPASRN
jgi:tetratricopeptide (TPR) repeat protein